MNTEPFMDAVVQMVLFLELSDSKTVNEDSAIGMLEQIAAILQRLGLAEKAQFIAYLKRRATQAESNNERQTLQNLAGNLGLMQE